MRLTFSDDLGFFLKKNARAVRQLTERTSVKDVIEACGVPHPEVGLIVVDGEIVNFSHVLDGNASMTVHSVMFTRKSSLGAHLQPAGLRSFVVDGHLGKLARNLRLLGLDVSYSNAAQDRQLLETMQSESRALITRDRRLLLHAIVQHGYCPRSQDAEEQTIEIVERFDLASAIVPFTRCLACNALLETIEKKNVLERLEPLTKIYYEHFRRCGGCGRIYWGGSHFEKLRSLVDRIRAKLRAGI